MNKRRNVEIGIFLIMKDDESGGSIYTYLHIQLIDTNHVRLQLYFKLRYILFIRHLILQNIISIQNYFFKYS